MKKSFCKILNSLNLIIIYICIQGFIHFSVSVFLGFKNKKNISELIDNEFSSYIFITSVVITLLIFYKMSKKNNIQISNYVKKINLKILIPCVILTISLHVMIFVINNTNFFKNLKTSSGNGFSNNIFLYLISVGILVPIIEEILYRGTIFYKLKNEFSFPKLLFIQAFVFGLIHLNLVQSFFAFIFGLFLGYIYYKSKNILLPIIMHCCFNTWNLVYILIYKFVFNNSLIVFLVSLLICLSSFLYIRKQI